ncbi:tumor necrosis factor alpha-induced protein 2 isoform X2 [Hyla sarda]|nr:tumor necrosis factor alpha-induced protein 2 isoform X2 [Hyla sarda]XP_056401471.1 tumor necrosis factor alpha-induced protein 2 isoform X2 [Hyla sarda]
MKKIKSTMAAVAQLATPETINGKKRNSIDNGQKKHGIIKGIKKVLNLPSKKTHNPEVTETKKEPTVEDIKEQIEKSHFSEASKNLIHLERKVLQDPLLQDQVQELESLYLKLENAVFKVITDSITETNGGLLSQAVSVIVEQEEEDAKRVSNNAKPRTWKRTWEDYVRLSVSERICKWDKFSHHGSPSSVSEHFLTLAKTLKTDLTHVVTHLKGYYPEDFDVCNTYGRHYHLFLLSQMEFVQEFELGYKDTYYVLCFVFNYYPNMILKNPIMAGHFDGSFLIDLLQSEVKTRLKVNYLAYEIDSVRTYMKRSLDLEVERWKSGNEPEIIGDCHHIELHIDIVQIYEAAIKHAAEINKDMADKVTYMLPPEVKEFLERYKASLAEFLEKNKTHSFYREIGIANLNCCRHFREFIEKRDKKFDLQQEMLSTILQCEDLVYDALFQYLYQELKVHFKKMSQGSALCSYQTMQDIIRTTEKSVSGLQTLCAPCYKDMIGRIQKHLVMEYLKRLLKKKVSHKNALQLQTLAKQINENANLISDFCDANKSEEEWLKAVIPKVAEIIRLQDVCAIQLEVATLVEAYPDIRNKQIEAILYFKGNLTRQDIKYILKVAEAVERRPSGKHKLFELIL